MNTAKGSKSGITSRRRSLSAFVWRLKHAPYRLRWRLIKTCDRLILCYAKAAISSANAAFRVSKALHDLLEEDLTRTLYPGRV